MALEQSIDRLSTLIEQLIYQLELGRGGNVPKPEAVPEKEKAPEAPKAKSAKAEKASPSSGATKESDTSTAPSASGESTGPKDCLTDVAPAFSKLVAKDRTAAVALLKKYQDQNGKTGKLCDVLKPEDLEGCLVDVLAALGE